MDHGARGESRCHGCFHEGSVMPVISGDSPLYTVLPYPGSGRAAAAGLKPLRLPRTPNYFSWGGGNMCDT